MRINAVRIKNASARRRHAFKAEFLHLPYLKLGLSSTDRPPQRPVNSALVLNNS